MRKLGVVVFGASTYDNHRNLNNPRFANSIKAFKKAIADPNITRGRETEILDLYNKPLLPNDVATQIADFVGRDYEDFIVYYCGHGDVGRREGDYRVLLRQSNRNRRHSTLLHIAGLIHDVQGALERKRVYFVLDACYSGSAISEMETMDAGGAENLIDRSLTEAVESGNGTAVLAASGRLAVAYAKQEDKLTLFAGALVRCLENGIAHRSDLAALSWSDIRDEIVRTTREKIGRDAPVPKLTSFSDAAVDITRIPFFNNRAYEPPKQLLDVSPWADVTERTSEHLYWKNLSEESSPLVLEDFLTKFPNGVFAQLARGFLAKRIDRFSEIEVERYLRDHPQTNVKTQIMTRLAGLRWERVKASTELAELEQFISSFPESECADGARKRIDEIVRERAEVDGRWEQIKSSDQAEEFDQFLASYPGNRFEQVAKERRAELLAARPPVVPPVGILEPVHSDPLPPARKNWRWVASIALVVVAIVATWIMRDSHSSAQVDADLKALEAAGTDLAKLRAFADECRARPTCRLAMDANTRISLASQRQTNARMEADRKALEAAGSDIVKLRNFVDQCKASSCALETIARSSLERA